jgi:hypothetical protein
MKLRGLRLRALSRTNLQPRERHLNFRRTLGLVVAMAIVGTSASAAAAAPKGADVHRAVKAADASLAKSVESANGGFLDAAARQIDKTQALELRAAHLAHRVAARSNAVTAARQLSRAAGSLDRGFVTYAALLPTAPAELQAPLVDALTQLDGARGQVNSQLTGLVDILPPEVQDKVLSAIAAFESTGDLPALIAAIGDPATAAAIRAHLGELIDQVVATLQERIDSPTAADLPPELVEQVRMVILLIQANREDIIAAIDDVLASGGQMPTLSSGMCSQLRLVFDLLEVPIPTGVCESTNQASIPRSE